MQIVSLMCQSLCNIVKEQFKVLVKFLLIFVADTKIIFDYNFVAPLIQPLITFFIIICHQRELATLFSTIIKHLISQTRAFQIETKTC